MTRGRSNLLARATLWLAFFASCSYAYVPQTSAAWNVKRTRSSFQSMELQAATTSNDGFFLENAKLAAAAICLASVMMASSPVYADEYGVEKEAPTVFTGESVMICTKRGILGACVETTVRTADNDNDKSAKYFSAQTDVVKEKDAKMRASGSSEGSLLIEKLRQQTADNKEKNDLLVKQKTAQNDQGASFGPFDRQTVILNTDGRTFTLLQNPQAMRLKKAGFIVDRRFVKQPTQEELEAALVAEEGGFFEGAFKSIFGSGDES